MIRFTPEDVLLVTGASSGFGAASALLLNSLGATVIAAARDQERLKAVAAQSANPQNFHCHTKDLAQDADSLGDWVKELKNAHGKLRGLLHCAGICGITPVRLQESQGLRQMLDVNLVAGYQLGRAFLDRRNNIGAGASMVFIASTGAFSGNAGISAYAASKGAVFSMSRAMACEFAPQGIRVNCISPAFILTPMTETLHEHYPDWADYPLGPGSPQDVAQAAAWLLSGASRWVTGQNIVLDGGNSLK